MLAIAKKRQRKRGGGPPPSVLVLPVDGGWASFRKLTCKVALIDGTWRETEQEAEAEARRINSTNEDDQ